MDPLRIIWATGVQPNREKALGRLQAAYPGRVVVFAGITVLAYNDTTDEAWVFDVI
jgi:hypothetical protein